MNPVLEHVINFKWNLYGKKLFFIHALFFYLYMLFYLLFINVETIYATDIVNVNETVYSVITFIFSVISMADQFFKLWKLGYSTHLSSVWNRMDLTINLLVLIDIFNFWVSDRTPNTVIIRSLTVILFSF